MCECFRLCSDTDIINFTQYLPIVKSSTSPWYEYLNVVYGSYPKLPYDIQTLEVFYPGLLPTRIDSCTGYKEFAWKSEKQPNSHVLQCDPNTCEKWSTRNRRAMKGRPTIIKSITTSSHRLKTILSNPMSVFLAIQKKNRSEALSNQWIEIVRVGSWTGEDNHYGCWFWRAIGSGIFIHTGNALTVRSISHVKHHELENNDRTWGKAMTSRNLTSLHILYTHPHLHGGIHQWITTPYEIVTVHDACMNRVDFRTACVKNLGLRTGWNAEKNCDCNHNHTHQSNSEDTLLCEDQIKRARTWTFGL